MRRYPHFKDRSGTVLVPILLSRSLTARLVVLMLCINCTRATAAILFKLARLLNLDLARHRIGARVREKINAWSLAGRPPGAPMPVAVELWCRAGRRSAWGVCPSLAGIGSTSPGAGAVGWCRRRHASVELPLADCPARSRAAMAGVARRAARDDRWLLLPVLGTVPRARRALPVLRSVPVACTGRRCS